MANRVFNWLFACRHKELTRVFTLDNETYRVCLACGKRIPFTERELPFENNRKRRDRNAKR